MQNRHEEPKQPILVLGDRYYGFQLYRWREAIMCFLDLVWSGKYNFGTISEKIAQDNRRCGRGTVSIRIDTNDTSRYYPDDKVYLSLSFMSQFETYQAAGRSNDFGFDANHKVLNAIGSHMRRVSRGDFESLLAQFARNRSVDGLQLPVTDPTFAHGFVMKNERGRLRVGTFRF